MDSDHEDIPYIGSDVYIDTVRGDEESRRVHNPKSCNLVEIPVLYYDFVSNCLDVFWPAKVLDTRSSVVPRPAICIKNLTVDSAPRGNLDKGTIFACVHG
jgi:hypothetical protein